MTSNMPQRLPKLRIILKMECKTTMIASRMARTPSRRPRQPNLPSKTAKRAHIWMSLPWVCPGAGAHGPGPTHLQDMPNAAFAGPCPPWRPPNALNCPSGLQMSSAEELPRKFLQRATGLKKTKTLPNTLKIVHYGLQDGPKKPSASPRGAHMAPRCVRNGSRCAPRAPITSVSGFRYAQPDGQRAPYALNAPK